MIFATDLDRTIIFSNKFIDTCSKEVKCIEYKDDKPISYMSLDAIYKLEQLKQNKNLKIIPVTTRSVEQYQRVSIVQNCNYAITTNGGVILENGSVFVPWKNKVEKILKDYCNYYDSVLKYLNGFSDCFQNSPRIVDNIFIFVSLIDVESVMNKVLYAVASFLDGDLWNYTLQGHKLYIIPKMISKSTALRFLSNYLEEPIMATAGDGKLDLDFLQVGEKKIIPMGSEILNYVNEKEKYESVPRGLDGTIKLFEIVEKRISM